MKTMTGIALLGAGRMAKVHAAAIAAAGGRIVTVFDPVTQAADALATQTGAAVASPAEAAMTHPEVRAGVSANSSGTPGARILAAALAG